MGWRLKAVHVPIFWGNAITEIDIVAETKEGIEAWIAVKTRSIHHEDDQDNLQSEIKTRLDIASDRGKNGRVPILCCIFLEDATPDFIRQLDGMGVKAINLEDVASLNSDVQLTGRSSLDNAQENSSDSAAVSTVRNGERHSVSTITVRGVELDSSVMRLMELYGDERFHAMSGPVPKQNAEALLVLPASTLRRTARNGGEIYLGIGSVRDMIEKMGNIENFPLRRMQQQGALDPKNQIVFPEEILHLDPNYQPSLDKRSFGFCTKNGLELIGGVPGRIEAIRQHGKRVYQVYEPDIAATGGYAQRYFMQLQKAYESAGPRPPEFLTGSFIDAFNNSPDFNILLQSDWVREP